MIGLNPELSEQALENEMIVFTEVQTESVRYLKRMEVLVPSPETRKFLARQQQHIRVLDDR